MYLLRAPVSKFGKLPPNFPLISSEIKFTMNVAYCQHFYWYRVHIQQGCEDVTPKLFKKLRKEREFKQVIFLADGGIGDVLWNLPFIYNTKKLHPTCLIGVITSARNKAIFANLDYVNFTAENNIWNVEGLMRHADEVYDFGGMATMEKKYKEWDPVDATFDMAEIKRPKDLADMVPQISLTNDEGKKTVAHLKEKKIDVDKGKIVSICLHSSTPNRNYPLEHIKALSKKLQEEGNSVIWLGTEEKYNDSAILAWCDKNKIHNLVNQTSLREAFCILALSDLFIGPNSALMVAAASLGTPTIAIFGAFRAAHRCKYYEKFLAIEGKRACSPCSEHWTECSQGYPAPCMTQIFPQVVFEKALMMMKKYPKHLIQKKPIS